MTTSDLEDLVLADLLLHSATAPAVTAWLPAAAFTPGPRRELYTVLSTLISENKPVDPLILAWEATRTRSESEPSEQPLDAGLVLRIGGLDTPPGTAAELGRRLLADRWCAAVLRDNWHTRPLPTRGDLSALSSAGDRQPAPDQSATTGGPRSGQKPAAPSQQNRPSSRPAATEPRPAPATGNGRPVLTPPAAPAFREPGPRP